MYTVQYMFPKITAQHSEHKRCLGPITLIKNEIMNKMCAVTVVLMIQTLFNFKLKSTWSLEFSYEVFTIEDDFSNQLLNYFKFSNTP